MEIGVLGAGTMGIGIAQVAAQSNHKVVLVDINVDILKHAKEKLSKIMSRLVEKNKISNEISIKIQSNINYSTKICDFSDCDIVIEAIVENLKIKHNVFEQIENTVKNNTILATNTSSLSVASIGSVLKNPSRIIGIHFFNPAPLMPLVEIIPAVQTNQNVIKKSKQLIDSWNKITVVAKDTPGFIVNRVARPFYGEALRIYEEGIADFSTIDWAMTELGGFKMGPFTLMDYIGNDVNYTVTETVFKAFYFDPKYKPSFTQKRYSEAGFLGKKSGRGYYDYSENTKVKIPNKNKELGEYILNRILCMLINEAIDAKFYNIASTKDIDLAMTKGVNYPKGLLAWANELGLNHVLNTLDNLYHEYGEERYRSTALLRRMVKSKENFII